MSLPASLVDGQLQTIHLLITRATPKCPMLANVLLESLEHLKRRLALLNAVEIHFAIVDPERPIRFFLFLRLFNGYLRRYALVRDITRPYLRFDS